MAWASGSAMLRHRRRDEDNVRHHERAASQESGWACRAQGEFEVSGARWFVPSEEAAVPKHQGGDSDGAWERAEDCSDFVQEAKPAEAPCVTVDARIQEVVTPTLPTTELGSFADLEDASRGPRKSGSKG